MDYLRTTEADLGIDLDRPLSEQDLLDRLNDLGNKKRKHDDDIHDLFRANKRLKSLIQYEDHPAGIMLNEPVLGAEAPKKARKFKKPTSPSKKKTLVAVEEPAEKPVKKPTAKRQAAGVQIRDTPGGSSEGADLESEVPGEPKGKSINISEGLGDNDDDNDDQQSNDERTESDDDKTTDLNKTNDEDEIQEDDSVHTLDNCILL
nr:hypothetical protein [Tanacetum cinerariifolium]